MVNVELAAAVGALGAILIGLVVFYFYLKHSPLPESPNQLSILRKNTLDFGVAFEELQFGKLLGKGSQGEVFRAKWRSTEVAVKKIDTRKVAPEIVEEFCQEAEIMRRLRHPSLTLFMGVCLEHPHLCIVTEIVSRGSLFDIIHDEHTALTWQRCLGIAVDIAAGMTYLHAHKPAILHRDLKSLNILVDENWRGKVADFGMTRFQEDGTMTQCGSPLWMAPEMIKNDPYDEKSDVYSFGVCLWEMYTRKVPYRDLGLSPSHLVVKVVRENLRPTIPKQCPKPYARLMERCWHSVPERRPTFASILEVLESFLRDPVLMSHKPMSGRQVSAVPLSSPSHLSPEHQRKMSNGEGTWLIANPEEVKVSTQPAACRALNSSTTSTNHHRHLNVNVSTNLHHHQPHHTSVSAISSSTAAASSASSSAAASSSASSSSLSSSVSPSVPSLVMTAQGEVINQQQQGEFKLLMGEYRGTRVTVRRCFLPTQLLEAEAPLNFQQQSANNTGGVWQLMKNMSQLRHPNITLFMGAFRAKDHVGVVMEHLHSRLDSVLHDSSVMLEWDMLLQIMIDAAQGMTYLHGVVPPVIHEDLRMSKLFVDENYRVKIFDYSFVDLESHLLQRVPPPSIWMAPEVLLNPQARTSASNVYSFAMIMWEVMARKRPFDGRKIEEKLVVEIVDHQLRPPLTPLMSEEFRSLLTACWSPLPAQRPPFLAVLERLQQIKEAGPPKVELVAGVNAFRFRKKKTVYAYQTKDPVTILKDWGKNVGKASSFLVVGDNEDVYMCDKDVFENTYEPVNPNINTHEYRKLGHVIARCMSEPFAIKTNSGSVENGVAGDYLVQNDKGDQWTIEGKVFQQLYEQASD